MCQETAFTLFFFFLVLVLWSIVQLKKSAHGLLIFIIRFVTRYMYREMSIVSWANIVYNMQSTGPNFMALLTAEFRAYDHDSPIRASAGYLR